MLEHRGLSEKVQLLREFLDAQMGAEACDRIEKYDFELLRKQLGYMEDYLNVLDKRIQKFPVKYFIK